MHEVVVFLKQCVLFFKDYFHIIFCTLAFLGITIDMTPWIKINPIRAIFKKISDLYSRYLSRVINESTNDIRNKLDEQEKKIDQVHTELSEFKDQKLHDKIEEVRWEILDFGNAIDKRDYDKEMYDHVIDRHDWYEQTIKELGIPNGRMDITYAKIVKKYNELF